MYRTHVTMWSFYVRFQVLSMLTPLRARGWQACSDAEAWLTPQFWDKIQFVNSIETICEESLTISDMWDTGAWQGNRSCTWWPVSIGLPNRC